MNKEEEAMMKTFVALQGSPRGWEVGYDGNQDRKIHWGMTFPSMTGAMEFINKQAPGKLIVVMKENGHITKKGSRSSDEHM
jgi:hypothetical protein